MIFGRYLYRSLAVCATLLLSLMVSAQQIAFMSDPHIEDVIGHPELVRSLDAQVQSTRLFNENIFAFRAALEDVAQKGIKIVVVDGDLTDDGQILNQEAAKQLLSSYEEKYGMSFFVTPGNHDPASPFGKHSIRKDFLGTDGGEYTIVSDSSQYAEGYVVNPQLFSVGHKEMMECYAGFGYMPEEKYLYWATPFSNYKYEDYTYDKAKEESGLANRMFTYSEGIKTQDASYVVEPIEGVWLLSIDCGVYLPDVVPGKFKNSGIGYNNTLQHKPYLIPWVKTVCDEAQRLGKRVIAFCHFPLLDCNGGASEPIGRSWGRSKFDIERMPSEEVSRAMMDAGVRLHFGGHMHVFNKATMEGEGTVLTNYQIPSLITAVPAYLMLSLQGNMSHVEPVLVSNVEGFDSFFDKYRKELEFTKNAGRKPVWSTDVLRSKDYMEFCDWQFRDLVRTRFSVRDVPKVLQDEMIPKSGRELMLKVAHKNKKSKSWGRWTGADLVLDFYRLHYSGQLALPLIPKERLKQYQELFEEIKRSEETSEFMNQMRDFASAFNCFLRDAKGE